MAIRTMRRFLTFLTLLVLPWQAAATDLPKIVSLNMCADAYLMAIAAPEQILALSYLSRDAALSPFHERAATLPVTHGGLEEILALKPQLVIVSPYSSAMKQQVLQSHGIEIVSLAASTDFAEAGDEILALGTAIGRPTQAAAYWRNLQRQLADARHADQGKTLLPLQRRGLTIGDNHILAQVMRFAGAARPQGSQQVTQQDSKQNTDRADDFRSFNLEQAIASKADALLLTEPMGQPADRGIEFLAHPALARRFPESQRIYLPSNLVTCSGATTALAVAQLAAALAHVPKQSD
jgi:iron complex transport system substrate-binding protein